MTIIYCDGGSAGNGTENARGYGSFAVRNEGSDMVYQEYRERLDFGVATNNESEYKALIAALEYAQEKQMRPLVLMDSALVVNQVNGKWQVKEMRLRPLCDKARRLVRETRAMLNWVGRDTIVRQLGH